MLSFQVKLCSCTGLGDKKKLMRAHAHARLDFLNSAKLSTCHLKLQKFNVCLLGMIYAEPDGVPPSSGQECQIAEIYVSFFVFCFCFCNQVMLSFQVKLCSCIGQCKSWFNAGNQVW
jgi:hypothetical protein